MPNESIVFSPEISERELDREVGQMDARLNEVGQDVPVNFDADGGGLDSLMPAGGGGMDLPGGGGGGMGATGAGAAAGLASKIPKPVSGVAVAAALPVALGGAVGMGLLNQMRKSSARLQTNMSILGTALDIAFRPLGNWLAGKTRPAVLSVLSESLDFASAFKQEGLAFALGDITADAAKSIATAIWDVAMNMPLDKIIPPLRQYSFLADFLEGLTGIELPELPQFPTASEVASMFGDTIDAIENSWTGWPDISLPSDFWPNVSLPQNFWPSIPSFDWPELPTFQWPDIRMPDWSNLRPPMPDWSGISLNLPDWLERWTSGSTDTVESNTSVGDTSPAFGREGESMRRAEQVGSGGPMVGLATGGRITRSGVARVHRGEMIADPDRLVDDLAQAIGAADTGGRGADMSAVEDKLDRLNRNISRLASEMQSMELRTDSETIGRVATEGRRDRIADVDPTA